MSRPCATAVVLALSAALAVCVGGCIGVETRFELSSDQSGTATIAYRVSQFVTKLGTADGEEGGVPLPLTEEDFRAAVAEAPGVSIVGPLKRNEDEEDIRVEATLRFDRVESLSRVRGFGGAPATLSREGEQWVFRQVLTEGGKPGQPVDAQTMGIVDALFSGYALSFEIQAPSDIRSSNLGQVTGRTVRYSVSVPELLKLQERTVLEVVW